MKTTLNLNNVETNLMNINVEYLNETKMAVDTGKIQFANACNTYFKDIEERKLNLVKQAEELMSEYDRLSALSKNLKENINDAVSRTDLDKAALLEVEFDKITIEIKTLEKKMALAACADL